MHAHMYHTTVYGNFVCDTYHGVTKFAILLLQSGLAKNTACTICLYASTYHVGMHYMCVLTYVPIIVILNLVVYLNIYSYFTLYLPVTFSVILSLAITGGLALITATSHWITVPLSFVLNCEIL